MKIRYCLSEASGQRELTPSELSQPFLLAPLNPHATLTLGDYCAALESFLLLDDARRALDALEAEAGRRLSLDDVQLLRICSDKHGAFYHIAHTEWFLPGCGWRRLAVIAALSTLGQKVLEDDFSHLQRLQRVPGGFYLPRVFGMAAFDGPRPAGQRWIMVLAEWLDDFHEWHHTCAGGGDADPAGNYPVLIWDSLRGRHPATPREYGEIFRQTAFILTHYYDLAGFNHIYPWHHAAGDFVVSGGGSDTGVMLTTVRGYGPMPFFSSTAEVNPYIPLTYFCLNLLLRTRLDKLDGTGAGVWAADDILELSLEGIFQALQAKETGNPESPVNCRDFRQLLKGFGKDELLAIYDSLLPLYAADDPADLALIHMHLEAHAVALIKAIQNLAG